MFKAHTSSPAVVGLVFYLGQCRHPTLEVCRSISPMSRSSISTFFGGSPYRDIPRPTGDLLLRYSTMQCPSQLTEVTAALDAASRIRFLLAACSVNTVLAAPLHCLLRGNLCWGRGGLVAAACYKPLLSPSIPRSTVTVA